MKKGEGKTEGKTIQPRFTKLDEIGQNSHEKRLRGHSKQPPGQLKKPLAEFVSPPSPPRRPLGNWLLRRFYVALCGAGSAVDSRTDSRTVHVSKSESSLEPLFQLLKTMLLEHVNEKVGKANQALTRLRFRLRLDISIFRYVVYRVKHEKCTPFKINIRPAEG